MLFHKQIQWIEVLFITFIIFGLGLNYMQIKWAGPVFIVSSVLLNILYIIMGFLCFRAIKNRLSKLLCLAFGYAMAAPVFAILFQLMRWADSTTLMYVGTAASGSLGLILLFFYLLEKEEADKTLLLELLKRLGGITAICILLKFIQL